MQVWGVVLESTGTATEAKTRVLESQLEKSLAQLTQMQHANNTTAPESKLNPTQLAALAIKKQVACWYIEEIAPRRTNLISRETIRLVQLLKTTLVDPYSIETRESASEALRKVLGSVCVLRRSKRNHVCR